jgi:ParB-like chromosome segregation protein Spo0J
MSDTWRSRIVGTGTEDPTQLVANPRNWRIHPEGQQDALGSVLDEVGWVGQVLVNRTTGHVVDGHLRVELALARDEPEVPVLYVELTEQEEALVLASLDPLSAMAAADEDKLRGLLAEVTIEQADLAAMMASPSARRPTQTSREGRRRRL